MYNAECRGPRRQLVLDLSVAVYVGLLTRPVIIRLALKSTSGFFAPVSLTKKERFITPIPVQNESEHTGV
jgi:hypothetical protein